MGLPFSERTLHFLGQRFVCAHLAQAVLDRWRDRAESIASGSEHLGRILHRGNFDERVTELRRIVELRAVLLRPQSSAVPSARVVLDDLADPADVVRVEQVCAEKTGFHHGDLDGELLHFGCDRQRKPFYGKLRRCIAAQCFESDHAGDGTDIDDVSRTLAAS